MMLTDQYLEMESDGIGYGWQPVDLGSNCGGETVSIHAVRERPAGFLNVKSIACIALKLVDKVHRLAVGMGSYGVSEVGT